MIKYFESFVVPLHIGRVKGEYETKNYKSQNDENTSKGSATL